MVQAARARLEVLKDVRALAEECRELDDRRVLVLDRTIGRWKRSGIEFRESTSTLLVGAHLFHLCDGKVAKLVAYADRDRALAELGLEGPAVSRVNVEIVRAALDAFMRGDWESAL